MINWQDVYDFWFKEIDSKLWFVKDESFDQLLRERFTQTHFKASRCELAEWREHPKGRLAEIIVLDQFSRNMFRDTAKAFAYDSLALALSQEAISQQADTQLSSDEQSFLYMPFMHSESAMMHEQAVVLFSKEGLESNLRFEHAHKKIIDQFGRYPHRNEILGRQSSEQELEFLQSPGSSF